MAYVVLGWAIGLAVALTGEYFLVIANLKARFEGVVVATESSASFQGLVLDTGGLATVILNVLRSSGVGVVELKVSHPGRQSFRRENPLPSFIQSLLITRELVVLRGYTFEAAVYPETRLLSPRLWRSLGFSGLTTLLAFLGVLLFRSMRESEKLRQREIVSEQVAHDIRSPLSVLKLVEEDYQGSFKELLSQANERILAIVADLSPRSEGDLSTPIAVKPILQALAVEKAIESENRKAVTLLSDISLSEQENVLCSPADLQRVVSNLINNAVEASDPGQRVHLQASVEGKTMKVIVSDCGTGIPKRVLKKLGRRGVTFGKKGGSGIGVADAMDKAKSWGGRLVFRSELGQGTEAQLSVPIST